MFNMVMGISYHPALGHLLNAYRGEFPAPSQNPYAQFALPLIPNRRREPEVEWAALQEALEVTHG